MLVLTGLSLILLLWQRPAASAYMTAADLLTLCRAEQSGDEVSCRGYIAGIVDYHNLIRSLGTSPSVDFCVPENATIGQVTQAVLDYLAKSPQHDSFIASPAVALALYQSFPCQR